MSEKRRFGWLMVRVMGAVCAGFLMPTAVPASASAGECDRCAQECGPEGCDSWCVEPDEGESSWKSCEDAGTYCKVSKETCAPKEAD